MTDPYKILGVAPTATDDEVKKAYLALARKYHPDKYTDSDLADLASEKMKEVNAAYEEIQNMRQSGGSQTGNAYGQSQYSGSYSGGGQSNNSAFFEIRRLINMGYIDEAERRLSEIGIPDRNAEWKFLMGCVCVRRMRYADAEMHFNNACNENPYNTEYRIARDNLRNRTAGYGGSYQTGNMGGNGCDCCTSLLCADCCCECMGGDLIRCC